jgi:hypothetical protein
MTDLDKAAEYAAAADAWRLFCAIAIGPKGGNVNAPAYGQPLAVLFLAGICEPPEGEKSCSGDLLADVLSGMVAIMRRLNNTAKDGGGGGLFVERDALDEIQRRFDMARELRVREILARKLVGPKGGAT